MMKKYLIVVLAIAILVTGSVLAQERPEITKICNAHITFGKDASKEAVISWRSSEENAVNAYVEYWPDGQENQKKDAKAEHHSYRYARDQVYLYDARLTGLQPDTLYNYKIYCAGEESSAYNFYSGIEPGSNKNFTFAVFGDSRGGYDICGQLMRYAYEAGARFVVFTGDMTDGASQMEWDFWFAGLADTLPYLPFMPLHGNHEVMSHTYFDQFVLPDDEINYSFDFGMTHWTIITDNTKALIEEAKPWVIEDLASSDARWKFFANHIPFYTTVKGNDPEESPAPILETVLVDGGVTMTFAGHKHNYERSHPLLNGEMVENGKGIIHQVTGGAGAPLYDFADREYFSAAREVVYHVIIYDITPEMMKATVKAVNGNIVDEYIVYPRER